MSTSSTNHKTQFHRQQSASDAGSVGGGGEVNSFVQRNTVQNQFAALSADRNRFAQEVEEANNELKVVQKEHKAIKVGRDDLFKQNRQAQEILGETKARLGMLKERKARIAQMTENESRAIHNCANHSKTLDTKKDGATKNYIAEMDILNEDNSKFLQARIEKGIVGCISVRSVEAVIIPAFDTALRDNNKPQISNQMKNIHDSFEKLKASSARRDDSVARLQELHLLLRERGVVVNIDDEDMMKQLEERHKYECNATSNHHEEGKKHMELFYGPSKPEEATEEDAE